MEQQIMAGLRQWGCDTGCVRSRFVGDEKFYLRLLRQVICDESFALLRRAADEKNGLQAFEAAHSLKGMLGNMGLTPLFQSASQITELLRGGVWQDITASLDQLEQGREYLRDLISRAESARADSACVDAAQEDSAGS